MSVNYVDVLWKENRIKYGERNIFDWVIWVIGWKIF